MQLISNAAVPRVIDALAVTLAQATQLARTRLASTASPILRLMIQRDHEASESELLRRESDILRAGRQNMPTHKRPDYQPAQRLAILQLMRLRGWNIKTVARHFVIHENTVRAWLKAVESQRRPGLFSGVIVWNRLDDGVRWAAGEIRRLCPEPEPGSRTIARHLLRAGIQISRSTVQRVLREANPEKPPRKPRPALEEPVGAESHGLLKPKRPGSKLLSSLISTDPLLDCSTLSQRSCVWHCDITQIRVLWFTFFIAAVLDGFSRKLLAMKVYASTPCSHNLAAMVRSATVKHGKPKFLITDNGSQFRKLFGKAMRQQKVRHVRTRVRAPFLNGKVERLFRTMKLWSRLILFGFSARSIQRRLDTFRDWYNSARPHSALGIRTPEEVFTQRAIPQPVAYRARDGPDIQIEIPRRCYRHDPHLPVIGITVRRAA